MTSTKWHLTLVPALPAETVAEEALAVAATALLRAQQVAAVVARTPRMKAQQR